MTVAVTAADLYAVEVPAGEVFRIRVAAFQGTTYFVCQLHAGDQTGTGYGFVFNREDGTAMLPLLRHLVESEVLGHPISPREAHRRLVAHLAFTGIAGIGISLVGAIDMALWDLHARASGLSLCQLLGGVAKPLDAYITCGSIDTPPEGVRSEVERAMAAGYSGVKIKVGGDPFEDEARVRAAREVGGPELRLMVDANQVWDFKEARRLIERWRSFDLHWVEEPIDAYDFDGLRRLREESVTSIAVGETYYTAEPFRRLLVDSVADVLTVNPQKVGGITPFLEIIAAANLLGVRVTCHTFSELAGQLLPFAKHVEMVEVVPWMLPLFANAPRIEHGSVLTADGPGLGLDLDLAKIGLVAAAHEHLA